MISVPKTDIAFVLKIEGGGESKKKIVMREAFAPKIDEGDVTRMGKRKWVQLDN